MRKLFLGIGTTVIAMIVSLVVTRQWVCTQALHAIGSATGAKAEAESVDMSFGAGSLRFHGLTLTWRPGDSLWERISVTTGAGKICWREWSSDVIPLEVTLEDCTVKLRSGSRIGLLKDQIQLPRTMPTVAPPIIIGAEQREESHRLKIVLAALTARNVSIMGEPNQPALASGVLFTARRGMAGWQGTVTADRVGEAAFPLERVQVGFSTETTGTRLAEFSCNIKGGVISGQGWCCDEGLAALDLHLDALPLDAIAPDWCDKALSGLVSGGFSYKGDLLRWQEGAITGNFALKDGALKLGAASKLLALVGNPEAGGALRLDSASGVLALTRDEWTLSNLSLTKADFFALEGDLKCSRGAKIKADLKLGISSRFPLLTPQVGSGTQASGFNWTTLSVETTPQQLWQGILAAIVAPPRTNPDQPESQKAALPEKANKAVDSVLNFLTR